MVVEEQYFDNVLETSEKLERSQRLIKPTAEEENVQEVVKKALKPLSLSLHFNIVTVTPFFNSRQKVCEV